MTAVLFAALLGLAVQEPNSAEGYLVAGEQMMEQGAPQAAVQAFRRAAELSDGPCLPCERGAALALLRSGRPLEAEPHARRAWELAGDNGDDRWLLARALTGRPGVPTEESRLDEAERLLRQEVASGRGAARLSLGEVLARRGRTAQARKTLRRYLRRAPEGVGRLRARQLLDDPRCAIRSCLPAFEAVATDGDVWNNASLRGRVAVLDFWAAWCEPCIEAIPELRDLNAVFEGRPFVMLGLNRDPEETTLLETVSAHGVDWPQIWDPRGALTGDRFGVRSFPSHVVVDAEGVVRAQFDGWTPGLAARLREVVERLLDEAAAQR